MTIVGVSKITSKGQVTLPKSVRNLLKLSRGQSVAFGIGRNGIVLSRCTIEVDRTPFSKTEWQKIEKLTGEKGKAFDNIEDTKKYLRAL